MTYQFKIELDYSEPTVWRRVTVPANFTFDDFHLVIQIAMGWGNAHMYQFNTGRPYASDSIQLIFEDDEDFIFSRKDFEQFDSQKMTLSEYFGTAKRKINYLYDFGDDWFHTITREKILKEVTLYPMCTGGEESCPPEDCGGIGGYYQMLEILDDPSQEEYEETRRWLGLKKNQIYKDVFQFDVAKVNKILLAVHKSK